MTTRNKQLHGHDIGALVRTGTSTTHASANTTNPINHGLVDKGGNAIDPTKYAVLAIPLNNNEGVLYTGATAISATQIDILTPGTAVPYRWFIFHIGDIDAGAV